MSRVPRIAYQQASAWEGSTDVDEENKIRKEDSINFGLRKKRFGSSPSARYNDHPKYNLNFLLS